jgi:type IV secretory pathway TraG/TraD family ATPase VirD4
MLGGSLYDPGWIVGRPDDRHFITIATSRSGKGRSAIIPNLLKWPGSALVIDRKGQNAAVTAAARGHGGGRVKKGMGQTVRIVDPFGELKAQGVDLETHRYNPLTALDPAALDVVEQIRRLTEFRPDRLARQHMGDHPGDDGRGRAVPEIHAARRVRHHEGICAPSTASAIA